MKVNEIVRDVQVSEGVKEKVFTIHANKMEFHILSTNIYSDKIRAIIRELSANAWDSHVDAKNPAPITVHLPNMLEPYFFVRDNGTGMSPETVEDLYTAYFESNKTDSDDKTGCLGLGSKSPFSYTEQFTVESRYNSTKTVYTCFVNEKGIPSIGKMGESPTTEPNGVEIRFPVQKSDFHDFQVKARQTLGWFKPLPVVLGFVNFVPDVRDYTTRTSTYGLLENNSYGNSFIVMGNIAYKVDVHAVRNLNEVERKIFNWGIDLFVEIGDIDFTSNREEVSYDTKTLAKIKERLGLAAEDIKKNVEELVAKAPTLWQARRALREIKNGILGQIRSNMPDPLWQGQAITDLIKTKSFDSPPSLEIFSLRKENYKRSDDEVIHCDDTLVFVNDLERGAYTRVLNYLKERNIKNAYMLTFPNVLSKYTFYKQTGIEEVVVLVSSLPKPERQKNTRTKSEKATLNEFTGHRGTACADYWKSAEIDLADGGVYVEISYYRYKTKNIEDFQHPDQLNKIRELLGTLGKNTNIYGVRPVDVYKLHRYGEWQSLDDYLEETIKEANLGDAALQYYQYNNLGECRALVLQKEVFTSSSSKFVEYMKKVADAYVAHQNPKVRAYQALLNLMGRPIDSDSEPTQTLVKMREEVNKFYPLLEYLNWYNSSYVDFKTALLSYINMVDERK